MGIFIIYWSFNYYIGQFYLKVVLYVNIKIMYNKKGSLVSIPEEVVRIGASYIQSFPIFRTSKNVINILRYFI